MVYGGQCPRIPGAGEHCDSRDAGYPRRPARHAGAGRPCQAASPDSQEQNSGHVGYSADDRSAGHQIIFIGAGGANYDGVGRRSGDGRRDATAE